MGNLPKSEPLLAQKRNTANFFRATLRGPASTCHRSVYVAEHHSAWAASSQISNDSKRATLG
jgi:hypothetical protein